MNGLKIVRYLQIRLSRESYSNRLILKLFSNIIIWIQQIYFRYNLCLYRYYPSQ